MSPTKDNLVQQTTAEYLEKEVGWYSMYAYNNETFGPEGIRNIKAFAVELLDRLKAEKLRIDHWRDKETTRDAVRVAIRAHLWSDDTGLPVDVYPIIAIKLTVGEAAPRRDSRRGRRSYRTARGLHQR